VSPEKLRNGRRMKFLSIALLLCLVGVGRSESDYDIVAVEEEPYGAATPSGATEEEYRYYDAVESDSDARYTRPPSTDEPKPMRQILDVDRWDVKNVVDEEENEDGVYHVFDDEIVEAMQEDVIPELCYLTSDNITIYNSYLLDRHCLEEFESVSPSCRGFKCDVAHYFLEHGAGIMMRVLDASSIKEGIEMIHREVSEVFEKLDMCTCGREFLKAAFKCAPFYSGNALFTDDNEDLVIAYGRVMRNVDVKSAAKVFDRLMTGLCAESSSGLCVDSIFNGLEELADMIMNTVDDYEDYDDGDRKYQKSQEKRCDAVFASTRAWNKDEGVDGEPYSEETWEELLNVTSAVTGAFYCEKKCKKSRGVMYPCCLRRMLDDDKMFDNVVRVVESVFKILPAMNYNFEWSGFYEMDSSFYRHEYSREDLAEIMAWTVSDRLRDAFMRTIHPAKYCEGKQLLRCSK